MKQMERIQRTTYRFWRDDKKDIEPQHVPILEERARNIINDMTSQGFTSGEMQCSIYNEICDNFLGFSGWWEVKEAQL